MKLKIVLILTAPLLVSLHAATQTIGNNAHPVRCDDVSGRFAVAEKKTGRVFLTNGRLEGDAAHPRGQ